MKKKTISAEEFDRRFDAGEDMSEYLDWSQAVRLKDFNPDDFRKSKRVSVDFPSWMVSELDAVSKRLGVTRQSVIKFYISDKLKEERAQHKNEMA